MRSKMDFGFYILSGGEIQFTLTNLNLSLNDIELRHDKKELSVT